MKKSNNKIKPQAEIRQSQLLSTFGPGAMVDLPKYSVVIGGLTYWKGEMQPIREDRLKDKVCEMLQVKNIELFSPPRETSDPNMPLTGVDAFIFPAWFVASYWCGCIYFSCLVCSSSRSNHSLQRERLPYPSPS